MASRQVEVTVTRTVRAPTWAALAIVQDLWRLADYEPKATVVSVHPTTPDRGRYHAEGRVFGLLRWRGSFEYALTATGFDSHLTNPIAGVHVTGGFAVHPVDDGCEITHHERYRLPRGAAWLRRPWQGYVRRTMRAELSAIDRMARRAVIHSPLVAQP